MKLGSSNFAWLFPTTRQSFSMCMVDLDLLLRSLKVKSLTLFRIIHNTLGNNEAMTL
jgi:hypothetical protein